MVGRAVRPLKIMGMSRPDRLRGADDEPAGDDCTTSTAAVYLLDHGHDVQMIGLAVSLHLGGMYVASPFTGWLVDRVGRLAMILIGGCLLIAAVVVAGWRRAATACWWR